MTNAISLGICVTRDKAQQVAPGYDYVELVVAALMPLEDDDAFAPQSAKLARLVPHVRAFNCFLPGDLKVVGENVQWDEVERYANNAIARAAQLGARVIVFGSGGSRTVPDRFARALAWGQLVRFMNLCADSAEEHGVVIAIEPLNHTESNILNSYPEAVALAKDVGREDVVRVLADIYHFMMDGEPLDDILQGPELLAHVHLSDTGRRFPGSGTYPIERLFDILKDIDYRGMASIECAWGDDTRDESARALDFLRSLAG